MIIRLVLWNLADSNATIEELRNYLFDESVAAFSDIDGLIFKAWVSDAAGERWGAFYVWESIEASEQPLPSRASQLIGKEPEVIEIFDIEATVSISSKLDRLGLAFQ